MAADVRVDETLRLGALEDGKRAVSCLRYAKKVLLLGDSAVGKTSLVRRYVFDRFSDRYISTIGTKTTRKVVTLEYEQERLRVDLELGIWDILGQDGVERSHELYFHGADAAIFVCDLARPETLDSVAGWAARVGELCGPIPAVLAASKVDLVEDRWETAPALVQVSARLGCPWFWTSARSGENLEMTFLELAAKLCETLVTKHLEQGRHEAARFGFATRFGRRTPRAGEV